MDRKRSFPLDHGGVGAGAVDLCLVPRVEIINVQSRWLNVSRGYQRLVCVFGGREGAVLCLSACLLALLVCFCLQLLMSRKRGQMKGRGEHPAFACLESATHTHKLVIPPASATR